MARQRSHSSVATSSTSAVGPAMPALFTRTSRPPRASSVPSIHRSTAAGSATSTWAAVSPSAAADRTAATSTSQTWTRAPCAAKALATARPIPLPAAVIATRAPTVLPSRSFGVTSALAVRVLRLAVLEREDAGVLDDAVSDLDRTPDGLAGLPAVGARHHGAHVRDEGVADLPRRRVPEVRRAVVDGVVVDARPDREDRLGERRRAGPLQSHPLVARDVDDKAAALEQLQILVRDEHLRVVGVLEDAVHDDVVPGQVLGERPALGMGQLGPAARIAI